MEIFYLCVHAEYGNTGTCELNPFYFLIILIPAEADVPRLLWTIIIVAVLETGWALVAAISGINIFLFYGVLLVASSVFWIPRMTREDSRAAKTKG